MVNEYEVTVCWHCLHVTETQVWQFLECRVLELPEDALCEGCGRPLLADEIVFEGEVKLAVTQYGGAVSAYFNGEQATGSNWLEALLSAATKSFNRQLEKREG